MQWSAKLLHIHDIVSVHFNNFPCMGIYDTLRRHISRLPYIYVSVGECWLTFFYAHQRFKLLIMS